MWKKKALHQSGYHVTFFLMSQTSICQQTSKEDAASFHGRVFLVCLCVCVLEGGGGGEKSTGCGPLCHPLWVGDKESRCQSCCHAESGTVTASLLCCQIGLT